MHISWSHAVRPYYISGRKKKESFTIVRADLLPEARDGHISLR